MTPTNVQITAIGADSVSISWTDNSGGTQWHRVSYRVASSGAEYTMWEETEPGTTVSTVAGLGDGLWEIVVQALGGAETFSAPVFAFVGTPDTGPSVLAPSGDGLWRPWFRWGFPGDLSELSLRWSMRPWDVADDGVGGSATAASGIDEAYRIREDPVALLQLRIEEDELPFFRDFLRWARRFGTAFDFRFEQADPSTQFRCLLASNRWQDGSRNTFTRDSEYQRLFIVQLEIRTELGTPFTVSWSDEAMPYV